MLNKNTRKLVPGLVSVIVPVYNRDVYISATINSILDQSYSNIEIIVINDGSSDNSLSILKQLAKSHPDKINIINQSNQGQTKARNNGIKQAKGEFIAFLDSDDLWLKDKLSKQLPLFKENIGLVFSGIYNIDEHDQIISTELCNENIRGNIYSKLLIKNRMTGGTVVLKHSVLLDIGLFDETLSAAENWDLWLRVTQKYLADHVNEALLKYRVHPGNMSKDSTLMLSVTKNILNKHLSEESDDPEQKSIYQLAYAHLSYRTGVHDFSSGNYKAARLNFQEAQKLAPNYKDCKQRIFRTYLGSNINKLLSFTRKQLNKIYH